MTHAEFCAYVRDVHGKLAAAQPLGVQRYVQNHVFDGAYGAPTDSAYAGVAGRDLVTELWFASEATMAQTFTDPYVQSTIRPDGARFNDFSTALSAVTREVVFTPATSGPTGAKIFYFLTAREGVSGPQIELALETAHRELGPEIGAAELLECIASFPLGGGNAQHFGGAGGFDAMLMLRLAPDSDPAAIFRPYLAELETHCATTIDPSRSFFVFASEVVLFDVAQ